MPLVSVIVPTRNRASLLTQTLRSIRAQDAVELEILVVDDRSTDGTPAIARAVDPRVRVLPNAGPSGASAARNLGIAEARGEWIAFCDDDDLWAPEKLVTQLTAATSACAGWVYSGDVNVDRSLRVFSGAPPPSPHEVLETLPHRDPLSSGSSNVLVRADVLAAAGGFDTTLCRTEGWDLWLRLASFGKPAWVCRPHVAYRFHPMNVAPDVDRMVAEPMRLARRYGIAVDVAAMHRRAAWTALRAGDRRTALRHYARAVARGDVRSIARAAFALVQPFAGKDAMFRLLRRDPSWVADAQRWLAAFTQPSAAAVATCGPERI